MDKDKVTEPLYDDGFTAVVLGGDMNCYGVARAFYEAYGIKTVMAGKTPIFPTAHSRLIERYYDENILEEQPLLDLLAEIERSHPGKKKFLLGANDDYVRHIIHNRKKIEAVSSNYIIPMIREELFDRLDDKDTFYELCEKYGVPYPRTVVFDCTTDDPESFRLPFDFPVFMKPASNVIYFGFEFEGKQKGYKIESKAELSDILSVIIKAGYPGKFVIQEYIEGDDDSMYIYSAYCDTAGRVRALSGGQIMMHDRTPELIGNYNAITGFRDDSLAERLVGFLEKIGFTGLCHFDIQYDARRKDYVVYEINIRQGRSNYYTAAGGMNIAELLVKDYIRGGFRDAGRPAQSDRSFIVSNVSRPALIRAVGKEKVCSVPAGNFYRFMLAPYDRSLRNRIYMLRLERSIMRDFRKYNKVD